MDTQRILIDTSIAVEGGEAIIAKLEKIAPVFVTDIVLQELDGHKNNTNGAITFQAREFFRRLGNSNGVELHVMPNSNLLLEKTDTLRKMFLGATPLHVIVRKPYKSRDINDSKIIEIAKDYNMVLVTLDTAQRVRGLSEGVEAVALNAIIIPMKKDDNKEEKVMSEIEKLMKKTEVENKSKGDFPIGATMGFLLVGALCALFFAFISSIAKPMSSSEFEKKSEKEVESTFSNHDIYSPLDLDLKNDIVR
jgi:predicted ribonuclease YlaK